MPKRSGFTLIEILITVAIISVISVIGIISYTSLTTNARDARRKLDLASIAQAIEVFYQRNNHYPVTAWVFNSDTEWIEGMNSSYISLLPQDPRWKSGDPLAHPWTDGEFGYAYCSSPSACGTVFGYEDSCAALADGQWYILAAQLENKNDPDRMGIKNYKWCDGNGLKGRGWSDFSYVITP